MVNAAKFTWAAVIVLAAVLLTAAAWLRGAEYDEQYTLFLTAGIARPAWPDTVFPAASVVAAQAGHASLAGIARDLRATDVHPPLYFWMVAPWRDAFGPGLFTARLLSVLCGVVSTGLVGVIARQCRIAPAAAMLVTLGCYGFVYTNAVARGFAAAEMFSLTGVALVLARRHWLAGAAFGAACCCNYLAVFVAAAVIASEVAFTSAVAMLPFLVLDTWFFVAQHGARPDQFPPFRLLPSLLRLAEYQVAAMFGGLPLYFDGMAGIGAGAIVAVAAITVAAAIACSKPMAVRVLIAAAAAPATGLLLLGAVFDNTPIELRYLAFGLPFAALLFARAASGTVLPLILAVQAAGIAGLLISPRTMQPARAAAAEAASLVNDGIVLLPRGNDGVGIPGAFGIEAPPALPLLLVDRSGPPPGRIAAYRRVMIAGMAQDRDSTATLSALRDTFARPGWRLVAAGSRVEVYERTD